MRYAKSKQEAEKKLSDLKREYGDVGWREPSSLTVAQYIEEWLRDVKLPSVEPYTHENYEAFFRLHIRPFLGDLRVRSLRPLHVQRWLATLTRAKVGSVTQHKALILLSQALDHAEVLEIIDRNPAARIEGPRFKAAPRVPLTLEQVEEYLAAAVGKRLEALVVLALFTTMRMGELLGLQWSDVDWAEGVLTVRHALKRQTKGTYALKSYPKNTSSRRRIYLPKIALDSLEAHRKAMMSEGHGSTFVFSSRKGTPLQPRNVRERFHYVMIDAITEKRREDDPQAPAFPRVTFHDLRHTAATVLAALDVHPRAAQERLGHSTLRTTMEIYTHSVPALQRDAAEKIDKRFHR